MRLKTTAMAALMLLLIAVLPTGCIFIGPPQIAAFQSSPGTINAGEMANLVWSVVGAESASISPGLGSVPLAGSREVQPNETTTYTLTARNVTGTSSVSVTVTVKEAARINSFTAGPPEIRAGNSSTLQWNVSGASSVVIYPAIGTVAPVGSLEVSPPSTTTYTLTAISAGNVLSESVTVGVISPPVIVQFNAIPTNIELGQSSTLNWNVTGSNKVTIEPELGEVPAAGSSYVYPNKTTVYVLTASSDCCVVDRSATVQVERFPVPGFLPIVALFNISPSSINVGDAATLEWNILNANSVVINQGIGYVPASGHILVTPAASTFYSITAYNSYGSRSAVVGISVMSP